MLHYISYILYFVAFVAIYQAVQWIVRKPRISGLTSKYVLITGCDHGFGNMLTKRLDKAGVNVFATCLTGKGSKVLDEETSTRVKTLIMDVTKTESIRKAFQTVKDLLPQGTGLWGLVNNAGISGLSCPYEWLQKEDFQHVLDINILGMIDVTNIFLPLIKQSKGRVVNIASVLGRIASPGGCYSISKFAVEAYSDGLRAMLRPFGIRVQIIEPGFFETNILNEASLFRGLDEKWNALPTDIKQEYGPEYLSEWKTFLIDGSRRFMSPRTDRVINALEHALTSWWPRTRYVVGPDAFFFLIPLSFMPAAVTDLLGGRLGKFPIPAACK
ncbi:retinol dehydrogenase 16-like [Ptychodera flava]|uniref:retinol dehydrogenase 16-like n=1 Tax=Ptychodera flava TaxID=63121 RepID=UPI00396A5757